MSDLCACGCGKLVPPPGPKDAKATRRRFVHGHNQAGARHHRWRGGRQKNDLGYILVRAPGHPRADRRGYVREHLLVAERALGRTVPREHPVHHANSDRADNRGRNLVICQDQGYHLLLEARTRARRTCGHADWMHCAFCGTWDAPENLVLRSGRRTAYHRPCENKNQRQRYARRVS